MVDADLAWYASGASLELIIISKNENPPSTDNIKKIREILDEYINQYKELKGDEDKKYFSIRPLFEMCWYESIQKGFKDNEKFEDYSRVVVQFKLLQMELSQVYDLPKERLKDLKEFFGDLSVRLYGCKDFGKKFLYN